MWNFDNFLRKCTVAVLFLFLASCQSSDLPSNLKPIANQLPETVSYNFHVRPILSDRCFLCHGPDADNREAELRLDLPESAFDSNRDFIPIVPGRADDSEVVKRILSTQLTQLMPPPDAKLQLSAYEKALLIKWINQGAKYEEHWAFLPEKASDLKEGKHPIDHYIDRELSDKNLTKAPRATAEELIRRATFDLTGLPPNLGEIQRFVIAQDNDSGAFEKLISSLLQRSSYGERMAADWLDVARYADSDGYLDDKHRSFYPWRDWVIKAFNDNMPYDQFATWQIAGDQIPNVTQQSTLATAFNRLHRKNSEAGIVFEEYRVEYVADRLHTFAKAFLGLTIECARCHDHKYDPISQRDYYQLFAFFNQTDEIGTAIYGPEQTPGPSLLLTTKEQDRIIGFLEEKIVAQEKNLTATEVGPNNFEVNEEDVIDSYRAKLIAHHDFESINDKEISNLASGPNATMNGSGIARGFDGNSFFVSGYNSLRLGKEIGWYDRTDPFSISLWIHPDTLYPEAGVFTHCEDLRLGYKGYGMHLQSNRLRFIVAHSWPYNSLEVISENALAPKEWSHIAVTYDGSSRADGIHLFINGEEQSSEVVRDNLYKSILYKPDIHTYGFHGFRLGYRDKIKNLEGGGLDEIKIFSDQLSALEIRYDYTRLGGMTFDLANISESVVTNHTILNSSPSNTQKRQVLKKLRDSLNQVVTSIPEIMVLGDIKDKRPNYVLDRGLYSNPGDTVEPQTPTSLKPAFDDFPKDRVGLAKWLFDQKNTLTARVMVNRIWQQHFGRGLVDTPEDFGAQGALPSHPELLDYLANYFREKNWDLKKLHRHIMTSEAYQRTSHVKAKDLEMDPNNTYLARGPRQRLSAEMIRDNALAVSELLVDSVGGPSVYPYQPEGLWDEISNKPWRYKYLQKPGDGLYRRSIYTIWKRTSPPPSMLIFDTPDRSFCSVQRDETNTPLQALNLLNDPHYIEAARNLAVNVEKSSKDLNDQLHQLGQLIWGRDLTQDELGKLESFYEQELLFLEKGEISAVEYFSTGSKDHGEHAKKATTAALARTAHNLLNTFEAQVK